MTKTEKTVYCDFCSKSQNEVIGLVAGPKDRHICNECVDLCVEVLQPAVDAAKDSK